MNYKRGFGSDLLNTDRQDKLAQEKKAQIRLLESALYFHKQGNLEKAQYHYEQLLCSPTVARKCYSNLGLVYKSQGKHLQARDMFLKAIANNKEDPAALSNMCNIERILGNCYSAVEFGQRAVKAGATLAEAWTNLGLALMSIGMDVEAIISLERAVELSPRVSDYYVNLASAHRRVGNEDAAFTMASKALAYDGRSSNANCVMGSILLDRGSYEESRSHIETALELAPNDIQILLEAAYLERAIGKIEECELLMLKVLDIDPSSCVAYYGLSLQVTERKMTLDLLSKALDLYDNKRFGPDDEGLLLHAISNFMHRLKYFSRAASYIQAANRVRGKVHPSDKDKYILLAKKEEKCLELASGSANQIANNIDLIFIVGMPRSGSTLVESILCCNTNVKSCGETSTLTRILNMRSDLRSSALNHELDISPAISIYRQIEQKRGNSGRILVDKNLYNFLYVSEILLHFPSARIIHCRRNPLDTILSILRSAFSSGSFYSCNQLHAAEILCAKERIMQKAANISSNMIYTLQYEDLVNDPDRQIKQLVEWLDWEYDVAYLSPEYANKTINTSSVIQARAPINSKSVSGWKNYSKLLQPAIQYLEAEGIAF